MALVTDGRRIAPRNGVLTTARSRFVGRRAELAQLHAWLTEGRRLVTIQGPPGAGKTRLASEVAGRSVDRGHFVDLTHARRPADLLFALTTALETPLSFDDDEDAGLHALGRIVRSLGPVTLLLDNAEHLAAAHAGVIGRLLTEAPQARALVTSRERLRIQGECVLELGPLALPPDGPCAPDVLAQSEGVALFLERVRTLRPDYAPDAEELGCVAAIVRRLDAFPLSIELAAARITVLDPRQLLARLDQRFAVLTRGDRDGDARHASLEAAIEASWAELTPAEQCALAQCTVFRGGFDLDAAEAVLDLCELGGETTVLDVLDSLRDRSLLVTRAAQGGRRLGLYESIREFASRVPAQAAARERAVARHARYYADAAPRWAAALERRGMPADLAQLADERDNLLSAAERLAATTDGADALARATLALDGLAHARGDLDAHLAQVARALAALPEADVAAAGLRARALSASARALDALGRRGEGAGRHADALRAARQSGDAAVLASVRLAAVAAACARGASDDAAALAEEALAASPAHDAGSLLGARTRTTLAACRAQQGRSTEAVALRRAALEAFVSLDAFADAGRTALDLAWTHLARGECDLARGALERAAQIVPDVAPGPLPGALLAARGALGCELGGAASVHLEQALVLAEQLRDPCAEGAVRLWTALSALDAGEGERARAALAEARAVARAAEDHRTQAGAALALALHAWDGEQLGAARAASREALAAARASGDAATVTLAAAIDAALDASSGAAGVASHRADEGTDVATAAASAMRAAAAVARGHVDAALAQRAELGGDGEEAASHLAAARERLRSAIAPALAGEGGAAPAWITRSVWVRLVARGLQRALPAWERTRAWADAVDPRATTLLVELTGRWYRPPGAAWVDLRSRRLLARLLVRLVEQRREAGAEPLATEALVESLWPGERILPDAAATRVYTAVAQLRKSGLRELLVKDERGYRLDAAVAVREVPERF